MGNDANTAGKVLKDGATGALAGAAVAGPVGAVVGGAVGGLVGLLSGGPEAQNQSADLGGRTIDAYTIYQRIHPGDTTSLNDGVAAAKSLQKIHDGRVNEINDLNKKMDEAWQGQGATAAQAGAHPLATWLEDSAQNLGKSHTYLDTQVQCFSTVHGKVQEMPKDPPSAGFMDGVNPFSDKDDQINKYNDNAKANVQAYTNYFNASGQNANSLPQYSAWQGNNLSNPNPSGGPGGPGGGPSMPSVSGGPGGGGGGGSFDPSKFDTKSPSFNSPSAHDPSVPNTQNPYNPNDPSFNNPNDSSTSAQSYVPPSMDTSGFGPGGGAGGFGGGGSFGAGGGFGGGGSGSGSGGLGAGGVAGFGPGAFGAGAAGSGSAAGAAGEGAGAGMRGGGLGAGAAGKAGASGMGGMGGARGGGQKGQGDEEHQTKYLVEEDANELFGTDELTAPPVIGE